MQTLPTLQFKEFSEEERILIITQLSEVQIL